ncbi:MAG: GTP cyclohydrolase I FolE [Eggerthellaceae bacterium]|nr:GTP cyclohydrolase I FolE [Eggerthellaceae bacterium]MBQ6455224.1 GTP cyclohydrolase I FolE [Eggerthellaceae bacterium]
MADVYEGHAINKTGVTDQIDQPRAEAAVRELLAAIGEDPDREGLLETPARVARMYAELLYGMFEEPQAHLLKQFHESNHEEMVIVKDIPFSSMCEHHLLPFVGVAHVAYIPRQGRVTGLSKVARVVEGFSHRLQLQERLTSQIADAFVEHLDVRGVLVVVEAEHMCMTIRGIKKPGSTTVTSAVRGSMKTDIKTREEALRLIGR